MVDVRQEVSAVGVSIRCRGQIEKFLAAFVIWALPTITLILPSLNDKVQKTQAWLNTRPCMLPTRYAILSSKERKPADLTR